MNNVALARRVGLHKAFFHRQPLVAAARFGKTPDELVQGTAHITRNLDSDWTVIKAPITVHTRAACSGARSSTSSYTYFGNDIEHIVPIV